MVLNFYFNLSFYIEICGGMYMTSYHQGDKQATDAGDLCVEPSTSNLPQGNLLLTSENKWA